VSYPVAQIAADHLHRSEPKYMSDQFRDIFPGGYIEQGGRQAQQREARRLPLARRAGLILLFRRLRLFCTALDA
jgi:hypothetical protein